MRSPAQSVFRAVVLLGYPPSNSLSSDCPDRTFKTNIASLESPPHANLHLLVKTLNPSIIVENSPNPSGPIPSSKESDQVWYENSELYIAVDLMKKCLELDGTRRWTAEECLDHPFFEGDFDLGNGVVGPRSEGPLR